MATRWKGVIVRVAIWLVAEIAFNVYGIDDLADYSEFVFRHREMVRATESVPAYVWLVPQPATVTVRAAAW